MLGAGEMTQLLRALAAVPEDPGSISSTYMAAQKLSLTPLPPLPPHSSGKQTKQPNTVNNFLKI